MKKTVLILSLVLAMVFFISGCSKNTDVNKTKPVDNKVKLEQTTFTLGHLNSTAHLLGFVAAEEGFFKDEGLNVTLTQFSSAAELVTGLESGKLDAAFIGSVPVITFQSNGHDLTIFGGAMTNGHGYVIKTKYVPTNFNEGDITVLKGRNVASVKNSVQDLELQVLLKNANIEIGKGPDKVNIVYFASQKDAFNAFAGDEIDAASVYSPYASIAKNAGNTVVYYCSDVDIFKNQPCCRQVALTSALAAKPNTYAAFERALIRAYKFSQENKSKTVDDVAKYITIDKKDIEYEVYGGHSVSNPDPDKKATSALKDSVVKFGYTQGKDYDINKLYNTSIYKTALDQLIAKNPADKIYAKQLEHFNTAD